MADSRIEGSPAMLDWLKDYREEWLPAFLTAGLMAAADVIATSTGLINLVGFREIVHICDPPTVRTERLIDSACRISSNP